MKKILITILAVIAMARVSGAQEHKKFRVGIGTGFTIVQGVGFLWDVEPGYRLTEDITIGMRIEGAGNELDTNGFTNTSLSFTANAQYSFGKKVVKPVVGIGLGYYSLSLDYYGNDSKFGFYPRVGVEIGHMHLVLDYNILKPTQNVDIDYTITTSYLSIRYGLFIGGGKKEK